MDSDFLSITRCFFGALVIKVGVKLVCSGGIAHSRSQRIGAENVGIENAGASGCGLPHGEDGGGEVNGIRLVRDGARGPHADRENAE